MKKRIAYIIIFSVILFILFIVILNPSSFRSGGHSGIHISDTASVNRIEIYGRDTLILERGDPSGWKLNRTFRANQVCINNFLYAFTKMTVSGMRYDTNADESISVRIRIYSGKQKLFFRFYPANGNNFIHREGAKKIYSVELTGASSEELSNVFSSDQDYWRDRLVMDFLPDEISMVEVRHPGRSENDFIIRVKERNPVLYESDGITMVPAEKTDAERLQMYMSYFINVYFDGTAEGMMLQGIRFTAEPAYIIKVIPFEGDPLKISVYPIVEGSQRDLFKAGIKMNEDPEMLIIRYIAIDLMLRRKSDFLQIRANP